jgi:hypothetical protein
MPYTRSFLSEKTSLQIPPDTWPSYLWGLLSHPEAANQNRCIPGSYCLSRTMHACWHGWWLPTSLLKITHCQSTLCRRRHHASEVQHLFSTRSLSDVSWGKVPSLTEWRNTPGKPGCTKIKENFKSHSQKYDNDASLTWMVRSMTWDMYEKREREEMHEYTVM